MTDYFAKAHKDKAGTVQNMFDVVAPKYDCFNAILSLGLDTLWRKKAIASLEREMPEQGHILDIGCGSGDLAGDLWEKHPVVGGDFCLGMLKEARRKFPTMQLSQSDATRLSFPDAVFKGIISAFVIRNIEGLPKAFEEFHRVLRQGGKLAILEFSMPKNPLIRFGFTTYLKIMFPIACRIFKGDPEAYAYLRKSIKEFGTEIDVPGILKGAGFENVKATPLLMGGVTLYEGSKNPA